MLLRWPFLLPFMFMAFGLTITVLSGHQCDIFTIIPALFSCLLLACFVQDYRIFSSCTALFFFFFGLCALNPWLYPDIPLDSIRFRASDMPVTMEGVISSRPSISPEGNHFAVTVEKVFSNSRTSEAVSGSLLLYVSEGDVTLARGDRIRFISRITLPQRLGLPGEFDYARYLAFQGISVIGRVATQNAIVLMRAAAVESWQRTFDQSARLLGDSIRRAIPEERVSSVLTALLIGDQRRIPRDLADAYTRAGVNHILSISGFHVGIIAACVAGMVVWLLTRSEYATLHGNVRRTSLLVAIPGMYAYLFLTGSEPATTRSVIMLTLCAGALLVEREQDPVNMLLFAAFVLVGINPPTLFDISFQLSFLSLWGMIIVVPPITKICAPVNSPLLRGLIQFVAASVAASCATVLPVLYIFKVASFNGVLSNFIIVPLLGYGAVLSGLIALPLVLLAPAYASLPLWPAVKLVALANHCINWFSSLPVLTFHGITGWDMFFFLLLMIALTFVHRKALRSVLVVAIPTTAVIFHAYAAPRADGRLHITMLSVGQAESMLIRLPDSSTLLVDGGGYLHDTGRDFGQGVLAPALGALGVRRIDTMIATHGHPDHSGGLPFVIKNFAVGQFWSGREIAVDVQKELDIKQVPLHRLSAGEVITLPGKVVLTVLSPARSVRAAAENDEMSVNEQSLVFRLSYGTFSMIFCADAGFEAETALLARHDQLTSTILKVGHHGSRFSTSEQFIEQVHPRLALISAGRGNRFGLPSARTLKLLNSKKITVYRTDRDGTIEVVTDGIIWSVVTPFKPE
ncbi:MAG: DNA internalization-related competence protein ComEC/Rec2 [Desulfuromonadaceae bacterium]|nr:DNA internalization-related competence protein ComEC/Rec2 [Desulfuromonadaceae bacterium]MDD5106193.1 DNA internalization-related competence protein ComEC/Rec2 [Desulfuromonadaceae bacterium]